MFPAFYVLRADSGSPVRALLRAIGFPPEQEGLDPDRVVASLDTAAEHETNLSVPVLAEGSDPPIGTDQPLEDRPALCL